MEFSEADEIPAGETLAMDERLVLAPCDGRFGAPAVPRPVLGEYVQKGQVVGTVCSNGRQVPVRSAFAGWMMGYLLPYGAPVRTSEPVVWLSRR